MADLIGVVSWKRYAAATCIYVLGVLAAFLFDRSLTLGDFHGLVFRLYSAYFTALVLVVLAVLAFLNRKQKMNLLAYGLAATVPVIVLALLFYL